MGTSESGSLSGYQHQLVRDIQRSAHRILQRNGRNGDIQRNPPTVAAPVDITTTYISALRRSLRNCVQEDRSMISRMGWKF